MQIKQNTQNPGRAGRFGTQWENGFVTTFRPEDLSTLKDLLSQTPEPLVQAGLHPTADQIELYAYHLPNSTLSNLMVIVFFSGFIENYEFKNIYSFKGHIRVVEHSR